MHSTITRVIPDKVQQLKEDIEKWRSQRNGYEHMPKELWHRAYDLLNYYPINIVSKELRLEYNKLKKHILASNQAVSHSHNVKPKEAFLELKAGDLSKSIITTSNCSQPKLEQVKQVEQSCRMIFERLDGNKLTMEIPTDLAIIEAIINRFLRG